MEAVPDPAAPATSSATTSFPNPVGRKEATTPSGAVVNVPDVDAEPEEEEDGTLQYLYASKL